MVARGWEGERNGELFNGYRVSVLQDEKSSGAGWWLHNNVNVYLICCVCACVCVCIYTHTHILHIYIHTHICGVDIYNGILFSHKKEWNLVICGNMDEPWGHYAKWNNKSDRKRQIRYDLPYMWNLKSCTSHMSQITILFWFLFNRLKT